MMTATEVLRVFDVLDAADVRVWVAGGWGIDALVGRQTREHDDLDLAVDTAREGFERALQALAWLGYARGVDDLPVRLVVDAADARSADLHPIRFQADGSALQSGHDRDYLYPADCFTLGRIGDREMPCLSAVIQREFHTGYAPRPVDLHDLALLGDLIDGARYLMPPARLGAMDIRVFESHDHAAVVALWEACDLTRPWNDPMRDIERKLAVGDDLLLVGVIDGLVVATVMAGYEGHRGWVNYLAVDPDRRREGLARALMVEAEGRLHALGCPKVNLQVRTSNPEAIAFYERIGYQVDDAVSLGKRLEGDAPG